VRSQQGLSFGLKENFPPRHKKSLTKMDSTKKNCLASRAGNKQKVDELEAKSIKVKVEKVSRKNEKLTS